MDAKNARSSPDGMGVPSMMKQMMERMCGGGELGPATMCQDMMTPVCKAAEAAEYATPELGNAAPGDSSAACCVPLRGKPIPR